MRLVILFCFIFLLSNKGYSQQATKAANDTLAPYQRNHYIPAFSIQTPDSSWFHKSNIKEKKPALILYFSPDCGHCQLETEAILTKMKDLSNLQIVMITSRPYEDMLNFANHYKINRFHGVKIGSDPARLITRFYDVKFTPFSALYDKKGKLVKVYKDGINMNELVALQK